MLLGYTIIDLCRWVVFGKGVHWLIYKTKRGGPKHSSIYSVSQLSQLFCTRYGQAVDLPVPQAMSPPLLITLKCVFFPPYVSVHVCLCPWLRGKGCVRIRVPPCQPNKDRLTAISASGLSPALWIYEINHSYSSPLIYWLPPLPLSPVSLFK